MTVKSYIVIGVSIPLLIIGYFFILGVLSKSGKPPGILEGRLTPCPNKPNCICSEFLLNEQHYFPPLNLITGQERAAWEELQAAITRQGGKITEANERYIAARFTSTIFGFVDDFEARLDSMNHQIEFRSASRVGRSDFGVNRKRVKTISALLQPFQKD